METWDYLVAEFNYFRRYDLTQMSVNGKTTDVPSLQEGLQTFGNEGWELVALTQGAFPDGFYYTACFKRRKP